MFKHEQGDSWWSWKPINDGLYDGIAIEAIAVAPSDHVFISTGSGIYRSADGGESWSWSSDGLTAGGVLALAIIPAAYIFAGTNAGVFRAKY